MLIKLFLIISIILLLTFLEQRAGKNLKRNSILYFFFKTKIHFILFGMLFRFLYYRSAMIPVFYGFIYVITGYIGLLMGFQIKESFLKKISNRDFIKSLYRIFIIMTAIFIFSFILFQDILISGLIAISFSTFSYYTIFRKKKNVLPYIISIITSITFLLIIENNGLSLNSMITKLIILMSMVLISYVLLFASSKLELYIIFIGLILLYSGFAYRFEISNIILSFIIGMFLTNIDFKMKRNFENLLLDLETPLFATFVFFMGYIANFPTMKLLLVISGIYLFSVLIKYLFYKKFYFAIPISQLSLLFAIDLYKRIPFDILGVLLVLYIISNVFIILLKNEK